MTLTVAGPNGYHWVGGQVEHVLDVQHQLHMVDQRLLNGEMGKVVGWCVWNFIGIVAVFRPDLQSSRRIGNSRVEANPSASLSAPKLTGYTATG